MEAHIIRSCAANSFVCRKVFRRRRDAEKVGYGKNCNRYKLDLILSVLNSESTQTHTHILSVAARNPDKLTEEALPLSVVLSLKS